MKKENQYIRFGYIPKSGRSLNYLKLSGNQRSDLTEMMEGTGREPEEVLKECIELFGWKKNLDECFEPGLSVFKADAAGLPIIETMEQAESLAHRIGKEKIFAVYGKEVGTGQDGEPLVSVNRSKEIDIDNESLYNVIHKFLESRYTVTEREEPSPDGMNRLYTFSDWKTGEKSYVYLGVTYK